MERRVSLALSQVVVINDTHNGNVQQYHTGSRQVVIDLFSDKASDSPPGMN